MFGSGFFKRERRAFPRWRVEFGVLHGIQHDLTASSGVEISEAGFVFRSRHSYQVGDEIDVQILLDPINSDDWIVAKCVVRRIDQDRVAVEFCSLKRADRVKLVDFICTLSPSQMQAASAD